MTPNIGSSLRTRLLLVVLVAVVPPLGLLGFMGLQLRAIAAQNTLGEAAQLGRLASAQHERIVSEVKELLGTMAALPEAQHPGAAGCEDLLAKLRTSLPYIANLGVADLQGNVVCSALPFTPPVSVADRSYFQRALASGDFAAGEYQLGRITGVYSINFGYPVLDENGEIQSVVFAAVDLSWLNELAQQVELQQGSTLTLFDRNGTVLARNPSGAEWTGQSVPQTPLLQAIRASSGKGTAQVVDLDRRERLFAFTPLGDVQEGVVLAVGTSTDVAYATANRAVAGLLIGACFIIIISLLTAWYGADAFALGKLRRLLAATERLAGGDLTARVGPPYGPAELGRLSMAFDEMALDLETADAERQRSGAEMRRLKRALWTAAGWIRLMADPAARSDALRRVCETAIGSEGYRAGWVWKLEASGSRVELETTAGLDPKISESLEIEFPHEESSSRPNALLSALKRGSPSAIHNLAEGARSEPWIRAIAGLGCASVALLPLPSKGAVSACLALCDQDPEAFGNEELAVLAQVAATLPGPSNSLADASRS